MLFVSYNTQFGTGRDQQVNLERIASAVRGADVIALQEVERHAKRTGMVDQVAELARLLPEYHWAYGPGMDLSADGVDAFGQIIHRRRQFGNMLFSKSPLLTVRNHMLPKLGTMVQFSLQRSAVEAVIETTSGKPLRLYSLHLSHLDDTDRAPQIEHLLQVHAKAYGEGAGWCGTGVYPEMTEGLAAAPMPREAILMGDFNLVSSSPLYSRIVGPLSRGHGRMNALDGLVDAWVAAGHDEAVGNTCNSALSLGKRIDFCFVSSALASGVKKAWIDEEAAGSDHQPIWTELDY